MRLNVNDTGNCLSQINEPSENESNGQESSLTTQTK